MADVNTIRSAAGSSAAHIDAGLRAHMNKVYGQMSIGMLITALAAWAIAGLAVTSDPSAAAMNAEGAVYALREGTYLTGLGQMLYTSPLRYVVMFAPLAFIFFGWGALMSRGSAAAVQLGFFIFAAIMGISMSSIFLVYTPYSITQTFLVTAIAFAGLSLYGYTTKKDLSGMGTFLMMGVIGLVVAMVVNIFLQSSVVNIFLQSSVVNIFLQSSVMMMAISAIGVLIFAGLTAYYTQDIKRTYVAHAHHGDQEWLDKAASDGALSLYISFLNMFQFLLMFMGSQE